MSFKEISRILLNGNLFQISDCALVLEEQPAKLCEAFRLFLQGEGFGKH